MDGKASAIARNNRNCATTNLVGGWERATIPLLFSRWSAAYWGDLSCTGGAAVFVGWAQSIFPNFVEIIFLLNSIALCLLSTSASLHYWCTPRLHSGAGGGLLLVSSASALFWRCCICWLQSHHISQFWSISYSVSAALRYIASCFLPTLWGSFDLLYCNWAGDLLLTSGTDQIEHTVFGLIVPYWFHSPQTLLACWWQIWCMGAYIVYFWL